LGHAADKMKLGSMIISTGNGSCSGWFTTFLLLTTTLTQQCAAWPSCPLSSSSSSSCQQQRRFNTALRNERRNSYYPADTTTAAMPTTKSIANFRQALGIRNIYRCASPDILGEKILVHGTDDRYAIAGHDRFVLEEVGLVIDLRSPSERNEMHSQLWMNKANMKVFDINEVYQPGSGRCAVRIDVLSPPRFMEYIEQEWFTPSERAHAMWYKVVDGSRLHELRIERLNEKGLAGLNEAILETGKEEIFRALAIMTLHLERNPGQNAVIHCVQGKDRTGMLIMLLQSILGVSDVDIIADYFRSNQMLEQEEQKQQRRGGSAATKEIQARGRLDRRKFSGTTERAMIATLHFLRLKYGSVAPGYLDSIGFDAQWRQRLRSVLIPEQRATSWSSKL